MTAAPGNAQAMLATGKKGHSHSGSALAWGELPGPADPHSALSGPPPAPGPQPGVVGRWGVPKPRHSPESSGRAEHWHLPWHLGTSRAGVEGPQARQSPMPGLLPAPCSVLAACLRPAPGLRPLRSAGCSRALLVLPVPTDALGCLL